MEFQKTEQNLAVKTNTAAGSPPGEDLAQTLVSTNWTGTGQDCRASPG